jgi:RNA polymerase sigma factor (sigma-70 family)
VIERTFSPSPTAAAQSLFARVPDQRLVKLAARGSTPAFATIYRRHHEPLYRYCRSLLGNDEDASDALQNTMLCALRGLEGQQREIALRPWLFRIAHNESVSLMRSRSRATPLAPDDVARAGGSDDLEARERFAALMSDIGELSPHQRSALMMRELSGLAFSEIAAALETSPEAAKQAVYQARVTLSELAEGRDMGCDEVRRKVSVDDRRILRGRRVGAHLRGCRDCREFEHQIRDRSRTLAGFVPTVSLPGVAVALQGALGGGAAAAGGGAASLFGAVAGAKAVAVAAAALVLGAGMYAADHGHDARPGDDKRPAAGAAAPAPQDVRGHGPPATEPQAPGSGVVASTEALARDRAGGPVGGGDESDATGRGAGASAAGGEGTATGANASATDSTSTAPTGAAADEAGSWPAQQAPEAPTGTPPGLEGAPASQPSSPPAPVGTSPGHGGVPPGHGGTPPGQATPPPDQSVTPPGQSVVPPGHGGTPPGHGGTPPGQVSP